MIHRHRRRRRGPSPAIDLAPLIDMVFILLIFFLVTSTFSREVGISVDKPRATTATPLAPSGLRFVVASSGTIYVDGEPIDLDDVESRVAQFVAGSAGAHGLVVIVPDVRTPSGDLVAVMDAAKRGGAKELAVSAEASSVGNTADGRGTRTRP